MFRHPSQADLFHYAECLQDGQAIPARTASHVIKCDTCARQVHAIRGTLSAVGQAPALEPSLELSARILRQARAQRREMAGRHACGRRHPLLRTAGLAASVALITVISFGAALGSSSRTLVSARPAASATRGDATAQAPSPEAIRKATAEIQVLVAAVEETPATPLTRQERLRRRELLALHTDLQAAQAALKRNPGCQRASNIVTANMRRQMESLRNLYEERSL